MARRVTRSRQQITQQPEPQSRARWTNGLTKIFADLMVDQVQKGNKLNNNSFSKKAWNIMSDEFYQKTGLKWDKEQLKNRYAVMRRQHAIVKSLLNRSEFRLDASTGNIIATNQAWNEYIKGHPDAEPIRGNGCPIYKQLGVIFSEPLTNGNHDQPAELEEEAPSAVPFKETLNNIQEEESSSESEDEDDVADNQETFQPATHIATTIVHGTSATTIVHGTSATTVMDNTTAANRKRGRKGIDDAIAGAILRMAAASRLKTAAIKQISERYSIADCIKELDAMQGVEEGVYFAALDLFDNPNAREIFLSLKV
ncbi:L10-interacting MYB domain-containing protein isoform X2 [Hevea brasiliensis]|uniref:L10-interacting MYB domain-containing protein isoform X2 n=1 Tax=Hevea brasiliensis TaxID=3981 RepID=UPI0025D35EB1|nr:L10-interacting MYB domain-containing protein isoform X2 [Hevea brasiliensis]